jgi:hypothetical protein
VPDTPVPEQNFSSLCDIGLLFIDQAFAPSSTIKKKDWDTVEVTRITWLRAVEEVERESLQRNADPNAIDRSHEHKEEDKRRTQVSISVGTLLAALRSCEDQNWSYKLGLTETLEVTEPMLLMSTRWLM